MRRIIKILLLFLTINSFAQEKGIQNKIGKHPYGTLLKAENGKLYGLTHVGGEFNLGVLFEYCPKTNKYTKLVDFDGENKGSNPRGSLIQAKNGKLYGLTYYGGLNDKGILFEYCLLTKSFSKKIDFDGEKYGLFPIGTLLETVDGNLYGITEGIGYLSDSSISYKYSSIFKYDLLNDSLTVLYDFNDPMLGETPQTSLIQAMNGKLYGVTLRGGRYNRGVLFEYNINEDKYLKKADFKKNLIGYYPSNSLIEINNKLYGTTERGIIFSRGALFEYNIRTGKMTRKCTFNKRKGFVIQGQLLNDNDTKMYGMTLYGGRHSISRIFSYDLLKDKFSLECKFYPTKTGDSTHGSLIKLENDTFWGMTYYGGKNGCGTIFQFEKKSKDVKAVFNFK